jgi:putative nucleotidyltransferase with HDIG domain
METLSLSTTGAPRRNRIQDLLYLPISFVMFAAIFQVWEFGAERLFGSYGLAATVAASIFPIAAVPMYTRLALGLGPMLVQLLAFAALIQAVPALLPLFGIQTIIGGLVGGVMVGNPKGRGSVVTAGTWAGASSAAVFVLAYVQALPTPNLTAGALGALVSGTLAGAVVLAISPLLERMFGHVTPLTLIEALSYDHPLLRRLITQAPGTFLHSTNLAVLTDAAARAIGADALVARVGALYHDVGKTLAAGDFIENQRGEAREDTRPAEEVARALVRHVTDGAALIRSFGLGDTIANFALEHHGTSPMRSLAHRAEREGLTDRRLLQYPGPRPRTKETAIVMIADQLEATARARLPQSRDECVSLVRETVARIEADGQLVHSRLTAADLARIELEFADVLHAIHHRRQGYPSSDLTPAPLPLPGIVALQSQHREAD